MDFPHFSLFEENLETEWAEADFISDAELIANDESMINSETLRFPSLGDEDLTAIIKDSHAKGTKKTTKWIVKAFEGNSSSTLGYILVFRFICNIKVMKLPINLINNDIKRKHWLTFCRYYCNNNIFCPFNRLVQGPENI